MNAQTPGPLAHHKAKIGILPGHTIETANGLSILAFVYGINDNNTGNAALFTAAYTAFDRAGRELGLDATELAKSVDLVKLIQAAADAQQALARLPDTDGAYRVTCLGQLAAVLRPVSALIAATHHEPIQA